MTTISASSDSGSLSFPGPRPLPLLGWKANLLFFGIDPVKFMLRLNREHGPIVGLAKDSSKYVFAFGPEYVSEVLTNMDVFRATDPDTSPVSAKKDTALARISVGLGAMNGEKHTRQRRLMMPAFSKKRVEAYRDDMVELIDKRLSSWRMGETIDVLTELKTITMSIVVKTLLGVDQQRGVVVAQLMERWLGIGLSVSSLALPFDIPGLPFHTMLRLAEQLEKEFKGMIAEKRASGIDKSDVLSMLIQARDEDGSRLTDDEVIAQTQTLFVGGHGTSSNSLAWMLFLLNQHPNVTRALVEELDGVLHGNAPTIEQLTNELPLLERVINESLRILPPNPFFIRNVAKPTSLGRYKLEQGAIVVYSPAVTNRNPDLYPQSNRFLPERWEKIKPGPYEYIPFGAGPRRCIGMLFAQLQMKLVLAMLLQRYRLELPEGSQIDRGGMAISHPKAHPKGGLPMRVMPQNRRFHKPQVKGTVWDIVDLS